MMRFVVSLMVCFLLISSSCSGLKKSLRNKRQNATEKVDQVNGLDKESPIKEVEEKLVANNEKLPDTHRYFVIIGSFRNPENAKKYQVQLETEGFVSEILKNEEGLYRASVMATDDIEKARREVRRIWAGYSKYSDTWLLINRR